MKKIILPLEQDALFISGYDPAIYFSIIKAQATLHNKNIYPWLAGRAFNCRYKTNLTWRFNVIQKRDWYVNKKIFYQKKYKFDVRLPDFNISDIQDILIYSLQHNRYIHTDLNTFYLPEDASYQEYSRIVEGLIYGADIDNKEFYFVRYCHSQPIKFCTVSFEYLINAICNKDNHQITLEALQFNTDFPFNFNKKLLYIDLYYFLNSINDFSRTDTECQTVYGIKSLDCLKNKLRYTGIYNNFIDYRDISSFYDLQTITYIRYRHLKELEYLLTDEYDSLYLQILSLSKFFYEKCHLFNETHENNLLKIIIDTFDEIVKMDITLSEIMLVSLKKHID